MRILALETSTLAGSVALYEDGRVVGHLLLDVAITHSERVMAMVDRLLQDCGWTLRMVDGLALAIGPGSFTGLRVGAATVKGMTLVHDVLVAPVPTLDALAANLPFADAPVCPLLDARKGEVYLARYRSRGARMERESEYLALPPRDAAEQIPRPGIVLGDGVAACWPYLVARGEEVRAAPAAQTVPSAAVVAALGHAMLRAGQGIGGDQVSPLYLRPSEAELKARRG